MSETEYSLAMPFLDQSPAYTYGFEAGQIWAELKADHTVEKQSVRIENRAQLELMARYFKKVAVFEDPGVEGWLYFTVKPMLALVPKK